MTGRIIKIRISGQSLAEVRAEVERLSALYHASSQSPSHSVPVRPAITWIYLEIAGLGHDSVLLPIPDVEHALAAMHALAAEKGLDEFSAGVAARIASALAATAGRRSVHPNPDSLSASPR